MAQTALDKAIEKKSIRGIVIALVNEQTEPIHVDDIVKFLRANGIDKEEIRIKQGISTIATNGLIDRAGAGYFAKRGTVSDEQLAATKALNGENAKIKPKVRVKKSNNTYTNEEVFTYLIEQLGDPVPFKLGMYGPIEVLLQDAPGEYILERMQIQFARAGKKMSKWTVKTEGPNAAVMFLMNED